MKKLTHLGCLLALVFAGASAFADSWFNNVVQETSGNGWSVPTADGKWVWNTTYGALNDWYDGAVYTVPDSEKKPLSSYDSKITTTVKFTAMDPDDLKDYNVDGAKAGVTVVEVTGENDPFKFMVLTNGVWTDTGISKSSLDTPITVSVSFDKDGGESQVTYVIDGRTFKGGTAIGSITSVEYKGQCDLYNDLAGLAWSNDSTVPTKITITPPTGYVGPTTIKYNHGDIKARFAERGKDENADSDDAVIAYMTGKQENGQFGWVNYALGQDDEDPVCVSNAVASTQNNTLSFNFGFVVDENYKVEYKVDGNEEAGTSAEVSVETGVHTVQVIISEKNEEKPLATVTNVTVGVMTTGKDTTGMSTEATTFDIVAVPWNSFNGQSVTVNNLLNKEFLNEGDTLYIWNEGAGFYDTYTLSADGWSAGTQTIRSSATGKTEVESEDPATKRIVKDTAIWIERSVNSKIVFAGLVKNKEEAPTATVAAGGTTEATWSLIANPSINPFALSELVGEGKAAVGDRIIIEDTGSPLTYEYKADGWYKTEEEIREETVTRRGTKQVVVVKELIEKQATSDTIGAGIGFWYVRVLEANAFTITFASNVNQDNVNQ